MRVEVVVLNNVDKEQIVKAIQRGCDYLFNSQNQDGGIKFEDETSQISGVWVTAEALEALLSSRFLPTTSYIRIEPLIAFLINSQNEDGSWSILNTKNGENRPSAIATGHCTYALKLVTVGNYYNSIDIRKAIASGEAWLRSTRCCVEKNGCVFWVAEPIQSTTDIDANIDVRSRMEYIFSSFYAAMGMVNPMGYRANEDVDALLLSKVKRFFKTQADFFIEKYKSEINRVNDALQFAKISSTICRIINAISFLQIDVSDQVLTDLTGLLSVCSKNPFMTTSITIHTDALRGYTATYNNNTPFDMANAFLSVRTDSEILRMIISEYLSHQDKEGFWFLNFNSAYTIKTWSTAEALIVLNRALEQYGDIELQEEKQKLNRRQSLLLKQAKQLRRFSIMSAVVSMLLIIIDIVLIIIWISNPLHKDTFLSNVLSILIIPLGIWLLKTLFDVIKMVIGVNNTQNKEDGKL